MSFTSSDLKPVDANEAVTFAIKNFGINTNGEFKGLKGIIKWDASNPSASVFNVTVDANTINTDIDMRDSHLKKEEYFDASKYPTINFVSTSITGDQNGYTLSGHLTIKGITKDISFPFTVTHQNDGTVFTGTFSINRKDFNVGGGSAVMGSNVDVSLKVLAR